MIDICSLIEMADIRKVTEENMPNTLLRLLEGRSSSVSQRNTVYGWDATSLTKDS